MINLNRAEWEAPLVKYRVLTPRDLGKAEIYTACILPKEEQLKFVEDVRGRAACGSALETRHTVTAASPTAAAIIYDMERKEESAKKLCMIHSSGNASWVISPEEEAAIIAESYAIEEAVKAHIIQTEIKELTGRLIESVGEELMTRNEARKWRIEYNEHNNEGGEGYIPPVITVEELDSIKKRLTKLGVDIDHIVQKRQAALADPKTSTKLIASGDKGVCVLEFNEEGYSVVSDTRYDGFAYLHVYEESAAAVTEKVRDNIIKYMFRRHDKTLPSLGATPQHLYFKGLTKKQLVAISNA